MKKFLMSTISLIVITLVAPAFIHCQNATNIETYLDGLSHKVKPERVKPQKYVLTTDYMDYDIYGNFKKKTRVCGECILEEDGMKKWNNIRISISHDLNGSYPEGEKISYMEDFSYGPSADILGESFFESVPQANPHMKNLVWDMTGFEVFAWSLWDSLQLNTTYSAKEINSVIELPGLGTFENRDIQLTWTGITEFNNKICRIIKFSVMNNPMEMDFRDLNMKGRSHYWGYVYVSVADKQIEFAELDEDVLLDIKKKGQETGSIANTVRYITLQKSL